MSKSASNNRSQIKPKKGTLVIAIGMKPKGMKKPAKKARGKGY